MNATTSPSGLCNCSEASNFDLKTVCQVQLRQMLNRLSIQLDNNYRTNPERLANADLYSVVILCLFAAIIIVIMIRAIKPSESLDDQVINMLNSMRVRCESDEEARHKMRLRKAKMKAKRWLNEARTRSTFSIRRLSSTRSHSIGLNSIKSQMISSVVTPLKMPSNRANSVQFLPEIIVTSSKINSEMQIKPCVSSPPSRQVSSSRASSTQSLDDISQDSIALDVFMKV